MIKKGIETVKRKGMTYLHKDGKQLKYKPWLGDQFSFLYNFIMRKSVFPKKFEASIEKHYQFLKDQLNEVHDKDVLELAAGSGDMAAVLPADNRYAGIDISAGLLRRAYRQFIRAGFADPALFVCSAEELPFQDSLFDVCICNLSLNFFGDLRRVIAEMKRVFKEGGVFMCSIPVPERNKKGSVIHGTLFSEDQLKELFEAESFLFTPYDFQNGALLYFKAVLND
jgi:SAM-dependent methyltransferase